MKHVTRETIPLRQLVRMPAGTVGLFFTSRDKLQTVMARITSYAFVCKAKVTQESMILLDLGNETLSRLILATVEIPGQPKKTPPGRPKNVVTEKCTICDEPVVARSLCRKHYDAWRNGKILR